jgi:hypothetical protein
MSGIICLTSSSHFPLMPYSKFVNPVTRRIRSACCARPASGYAQAAPPSSVMNVRRLTLIPLV